jgi:hypothetical protein
MATEFRGGLSGGSLLLLGNILVLVRSFTWRCDGRHPAGGRHHSAINRMGDTNNKSSADKRAMAYDPQNNAKALS